MKSYSLSDVALYVITAVMEGNCYELLSGSGNVENKSLFQKVSISESLYFYLNFLSVHRSTHSYWCQWRIIYSESERDTWIKSGTGEFVTIGKNCLMISIIVSSIFVWFIQDLSFIFQDQIHAQGYVQCLSLIHENVPHSYLILFFFTWQLHARRCIWVYVIKDVLMTLSG